MAQSRTPIFAMSLFTSDRERRLWLWTLAVMVAIYSTLGPAPGLANALRERNLLAVSFTLVLLLVVLVIITLWVKKRPGWSEIGVALGVAFAYLMVGIRIDSWEERTHLIEYGIVAALIHQALLERVRNGRRVPAPAALAVAVTALFGLLDEGIQLLLPNRVFDVRDVFFNALAGFMVIAARLAIGPQQRPGWRVWFLWLVAGGYGWGMAVVVTGLGELTLQFSPPDIMAAYLGVASAGILVGVLQWLVLRNKLERAGRWVLASLGAASILGIFVFGIGIINKDIGWIVGTGLLGTVAGVLQWMVLRGQVRRAGWWILASTMGWLVGIPAGEMVGWNGLGAAHGIITGAVLVWLLRRPVPAVAEKEAG
jgi:hypothetical protein